MELIITYNVFKSDLMFILINTAQTEQRGVL